MCRVPQQSGEEYWYSFNDEQVTRVSSTQVGAMGQAMASRVVWCVGAVLVVWATDEQAIQVSPAPPWW